MPDLDRFLNTVTCGDCLELMKELPDECVDLVVTDPPYGYGFMGKDWDKVVPPVAVWRECLRILKPGAFAFVMSAPRQDVLNQMIVRLGEAGFEMGFTSIYWAYANGFPKAQNIGKAVDKRLGIIRKVIGYNKPPGDFYEFGDQNVRPWQEKQRLMNKGKLAQVPISIAMSPEAKALDGSYGGFQPKPAVEVILVAMKPLSEKTFVDQALQNGKGCTWLDNGRIPYESENDKWKETQACNISSKGLKGGGWSNEDFVSKRTDFTQQPSPHGRFPANLICSDDVLNDGRITKSIGQVSKRSNSRNIYGKYIGETLRQNPLDSGSFSRYFSLDSWFTERIKQLPESVQKTFPFLIVPKASKSEKNRGCEEFIPMAKCELDKMGGSKCGMKTGSGNERNVFYKNNHPTVKPIKLFSYLITLGSRQGDVVLDPYLGSGTTKLAAQILNRQWIGFEVSPEYCKIAEVRIANEQAQLKLEMSLCQP